MISERLQEILGGNPNCGIDCADVYQRAKVLAALRDQGCDIDDGNYRSPWITTPEVNTTYMCPVYTQDGEITCYASAAFYEKALKNTYVLYAEEFLRLIEEPAEQVSVPDMQSLDSFLLV